MGVLIRWSFISCELIESELQLHLNENIGKFIVAIFLQAFKKKVPNLDREFYTFSTAQFIIYVKEEMKKGVNYVKPYLDAVD